MKISFYELLGMVEEGNIPEIVEYNGIQYKADYDNVDNSFLDYLIVDKKKINDSIHLCLGENLLSSEMHIKNLLIPKEENNNIEKEVIMNKELREDLEHLIICKDKSITQDLRDDIKMALDYIDELEDRIHKALELLDSYKLGKYDYALTPAGLLEFEDTLKGKTLQDYYDEEFSFEDTPKEESINRLINTIKTHIPKPLKEDKKIEKLNEHYYHDEPALIDDMAHKINEIIDKINGEDNE